jgi:predicted carbohydrate-binding protein with CBM5 and CBM33 domain
MAQITNILNQPLLLLMWLSCSVLLLRLPYADAHGYLAQPVSRNVYAYLQRTFYDHMSGNGVGSNANTGGPGS